MRKGVSKHPPGQRCRGKDCHNFVRRQVGAGYQPSFCSPECKKIGYQREPHSAETKRKIGEANSKALRGKTRPEEVKKKIARGVSLAQRGINQQTGLPSKGYYVDRYGYKILMLLEDHPLGRSVAEHRKVLYDAIGPGPHDCYWCGKSLEWKQGVKGLYVDHLDGDILHNELENLVPSCMRCNWGRSRRKKK